MVGNDESGDSGFPWGVVCEAVLLVTNKIGERVGCGDPSTMVVAFVVRANIRRRCIHLARSPILKVIVHLVVFSAAEVASKGRMEIAGELIQIGH